MIFGVAPKLGVEDAISALDIFLASPSSIDPFIATKIENAHSQGGSPSFLSFLDLINYDRDETWFFWTQYCSQ